MKPALAPTRTEKEYWAVYMRFIVTCRADGVIPINSRIVRERGKNETDEEIFAEVEKHNRELRLTKEGG